MNPDDRANAIAARIADGSAIDWPSVASGDTDPDELATLEELRAISALATMHRAPGWAGEATAQDGASWGPLTITSKIGEGRFGQVYLAWDARLQRRVALKILNVPPGAALASPSQAIEEARLLARVRHPNVLAVYGAECVEDRIGIWTEFIEGRTLEDLLKEHGPMPSADVAAIGLDLCRALGAVHDAGLLHRDIKLQNVMRETGGRIVLMDFGTGLDLEVRSARAGDMSGTPLYLAPEILAGAAATTASDVYALSVLLFRLLTGEYPVPGKTLDDVRSGHLRRGPARLRETRPDLPPRLVEAIERGLAPDPSHRHRTALAFEAALTEPQPQRTVLRGWPVLAAVATGVIVIGALAWSLRGVAPAAAPQVASTATASVTSASPTAPPVPSPAVENLAPPAVPSTIDSAATAIALPATHRPLTPPLALVIWSSQPSSDGRYWPFVDIEGQAADLRIWQPATGERQQVTRIPVVPGAPRPRMSAAESAMSADGRRVAYAWSEAGVTELRVANADGSGIRRILPVEAADHPEPIEWSRDGDYVLSWLMQKSGRADLALVPTRGGAPRILQSFETRRPGTARLSPDARFVVYDFRPDPASGQDDVFIVSIDGSPARVLIPGSADDFGPVWTPDGSQVFFLSNRSGTTDGWTIKINDGVASGAPVRVAPNLGPVTPIGITDDGAYYYSRPSSSTDVYLQRLDLTGSVLPGTPVRVQPAVMGRRMGPSWSPDGKFLAYVKLRPRTAPTVSIQEVASGKVRDLTLHPALSEIQMATAWSRDGSTILIRAADMQNRGGYFGVDVVTGAVTPAKLFETAVSDGAYGSFGWSADTRAILFRHTPRGIVERNLSSGAETVLVDGKANSLGNFNFFAQSPDGRSLAFSAGRGQGPVIFVMTGEEPPRELVASGSGQRVMFQAWTPDGKQILFTKSRGGNPVENPHELWIMPVAGGEARDTQVRISGFANQYQVALSPDGQRLAFTLGEGRAELWVMEGFLPKPKRP